MLLLLIEKTYDSDLWSKKRIKLKIKYNRITLKPLIFRNLFFKFILWKEGSSSLGWSLWPSRCGGAVFKQFSSVPQAPLSVFKEHYRIWKDQGIFRFTGILQENIRTQTSTRKYFWAALVMKHNIHMNKYFEKFSEAAQIKIFVN